MSWALKCRLPRKGWKMGSSSNVTRDDESVQRSDNVLRIESPRPDSRCPVPAGESHEDQRESSREASRDGAGNAQDAGDQSAGDEGAGATANTATDPITRAIEQALEAAREEHATAQVQRLSANAAAEAAAKNLARLEAAYAAITGQTNTAPVAQSAEPENLTNPETDGANPPRRSKRRKQAQENNPLAHLKCAGCGSVGTMAEQIQQAPSGAYVRMLVCGSCRNQSLMG